MPRTNKKITRSLTRMLNQWKQSITCNDAVASQTTSNNGKTSFATQLFLKTINIIVLVQMVVNNGSKTKVKYSPQKEKNAKHCGILGQFAKKRRNEKEHTLKRHNPQKQKSTRSTQYLSKAMMKNLSAIELAINNYTNEHMSSIMTAISTTKLQLSLVMQHNKSNHSKQKLNTKNNRLTLVACAVSSPILWLIIF